MLRSGILWFLHHFSGQVMQHYQAHVYQSLPSSPFNRSIARSLSLTAKQWAETVLTEARRGFGVIIKKLNWICSYGGKASCLD